MLSDAAQECSVCVCLCVCICSVREGNRNRNPFIPMSCDLLGLIRSVCGTDFTLSIIEAECDVCIHTITWGLCSAVCSI